MYSKKEMFLAVTFSLIAGFRSGLFQGQRAVSPGDHDRNQRNR